MSTGHAGDGQATSGGTGGTSGAHGAGTHGAATPGPTTAESPWPVRTVTRKIADWIARLGAVWVEGQLTQISVRPGANTAFLTLRDPAADVSLTLTCSAGLLRGTQPAEGARVVVHGRPTFYPGRGTLSLRVDEIRAVGTGELLARIERLRKLLAAEGLFSGERKRALPFLPRRIGLITGRASAAERDVLSNATSRWPAARFEVHTVAVQGPLAVPQILTALSTLDKAEDVDVIVLARGGGSVEDLLPFSDETLCRAISAARTPVVSAIGHEQDSPLTDLVADLRCSTPTEAGRRIVPDVAEETRLITQLKTRNRRALHGWVDRERTLLHALRSRPALADPHAPLRRMAETVHQLRERSRRAVTVRLQRERAALDSVRTQLNTLGPAATLARGYAVVQRIGPDGSGPASDHPEHVDPVLRSAAEAGPGTELRIRFADGAVHAVVSGDEGTPVEPS